MKCVIFLVCGLATLQAFAMLLYLPLSLMENHFENSLQSSSINLEESIAERRFQEDITPQVVSASKNEKSTNLKPTKPYFLTGKRTLEVNEDTFDEWEVFEEIEDASVEDIDESLEHWILPDKLLNKTRNHDSVLFELDNGRQLLLIMLGRHARSLQWIDLETGKKNMTFVTGEDPVGQPLNDLNHVYSVTVDSIATPSHKEVWLPCGFHGDVLNSEQSSEYARVVNLQTMKVEVGPRLPFAGGACVAAPIYVYGPDEPAHICTFGGTDGQHDTGTYLPYTACFDRVAQKWHHPFGKLPYGFDHGSLAHIPAGVCDPSDPARLLIFNYRTKNYGTQATEMLAFDMPSKPWRKEQLETLEAETPGRWYVYANITYDGPRDYLNAPRDAAGMALVNGGRKILNFGGIHYHYKKNQEDDVRRRKGFRHSMIRSFDVCEKKWTKIGDLGVKAFALQSSASSRLNLAITCGGQTFADEEKNSPWCHITRFPGINFQTGTGCKATESSLPGLQFS